MTTEKLQQLQQQQAKIERLQNLLTGLGANGLRASLSAPVGHLTNGVYNTEAETDEVLRDFWQRTFENFKTEVKRAIEREQEDFASQ